MTSQSEASVPAAKRAPRYINGFAPDGKSLAACYVNGTRGTQKLIRNHLLPGATQDEFERWVVESMPWRFFGRPDQIEPEGPWQIWLYQAGRGAGKTRGGAEWSFEQAAKAPNQIVGVMSPTNDDLTKVTFDGESGLMRLVDRHPSLIAKVTTRPWTITYKNGSKINSYTGEAYERLRGPQHHAFWMDEAAGMARVASEAFEQIMFGLRLKGPGGAAPRLMITSTPKVIALFKRLNERFKAGDPAIIMSRASTMDNAANLSQLAIDELISSYDGTRLGQQELYGNLLLDVPNALWTEEMIQEVSMPARLDRIVVAVDPSGAADANSKSDEIGIVAAGVIYGKTKADHRYFVLEDATLIEGPLQWARRAVKCFDDWEADRIVAETNYGGAMVKATIKSVDDKAPVKLVTATRGKTVRAEPISALYEQGRVFHVGKLSKLTDQMCHMTTQGYVGDGSPDRVDALVWAMTELSGGAQRPAHGSIGDSSNNSYWLPT